MEFEIIKRYPNTINGTESVIPAICCDDRSHFRFTKAASIKLKLQTTTVLNFVFEKTENKFYIQTTVDGEFKVRLWKKRIFSFSSRSLLKAMESKLNIIYDKKFYLIIEDELHIDKVGTLHPLKLINTEEYNTRSVRINKSTEEI